MDFILANWVELLLGLLAFLKIIVNLTPSDKDNGIFSLIDTIINAIVPNKNKKGGTHK